MRPRMTNLGIRSNGREMLPSDREVLSMTRRPSRIVKLRVPFFFSNDTASLPSISHSICYLDVHHALRHILR